MRQSQEQFKILYGEDVTLWSKTTKAAFAYLFKHAKRPSACSVYQVTPQALSAFIGRNKVKHMEYVAYTAKPIEE